MDEFRKYSHRFVTPHPNLIHTISFRTIWAVSEGGKSSEHLRFLEGVPTAPVKPVENPTSSVNFVLKNCGTITQITIKMALIFHIFYPGCFTTTPPNRDALPRMVPPINKVALKYCWIERIYHYALISLGTSFSVSNAAQRGNLFTGRLYLYDNDNKRNTDI